MPEDKTQLPEDWTWTSLEDIGEWEGGKTPRRSNQDYWGGTIPWVSPKDMKTSHITDTEDHMTDHALEETSANIVPKDSILLVTRSGILEHSLPIALTEVEVTINQDLKALVLGDSAIPEYVHYALLAFEKNILADCSKDGTTVASLDSESLYEYEIPLPPISIQREVVEMIEEYLTRVDAVISDLEETETDLQTYIDSIYKSATFGNLIESVGDAEPDIPSGEEAGTIDDVSNSFIDEFDPIPANWKWVSVSQLSKSIRNGIYKSKEHYTDDGIPCLRMYNIEGGEIRWFDIKRMELTDEELEKYGLEYGDVLVNRVNSRKLVGKAAAIPETLDSCVFESKNMRLRLDTDLVKPEYVAYWMKVFRRAYYEKKMKQTTGQATITQTQLKSMPMPLPPRDMQDDIVSRVETIKTSTYNTVDDVSDELKRVRNFRKSLLKSACHGRLFRDQEMNGENVESADETVTATEQLTLKDVN